MCSRKYIINFSRGVQITSESIKRLELAETGGNESWVNAFKDIPRGVCVVKACTILYENNAKPM